LKNVFNVYAANTERINLLYTQVLDERLKRGPTVTIEKNIYIYKSREEQIETIEKRRTLRKAIKKCEKKKENEEDSNIRSYKQCKAKKEFESVFSNKMKKAEEQIPVKRMSERDDNSNVSEEEEEEDTEKIIREVQENRPKKHYRNTDEDSETEELEASVILVIPSPTVNIPHQQPNTSSSI
jgi:hypothetical protein